MKNKLKILTIITAGLLISSFFNVAIAASNKNSFSNLKGRWIIQVEGRGQAYYVNPIDKLAYPIGSLNQTHCLIKKMALGISESDYNRFNKNKAPSRLAGRILFRANASGQAYYVGPLTRNLYPINSESEIRYLLKIAGLGISNINLNKILANNNISQEINDCQQSRNNDQTFNKNSKINKTTPLIKDPFCSGLQTYINPLTEAACSKINCYGLLKESLKSRCIKGLCGAECSENETRSCTINGQTGKQGCNPSYCQFFTGCGLTLPLPGNPSINRPTCNEPRLEPTITIENNIPTSLKPNFCSGQVITFSTTVSNCQQPTYQWYINDVVQLNANQSSYSTTVNNNDVIKVVLNCLDECLNTNTDISSFNVGSALETLNVTNPQLEETGNDSISLLWDNSDCANNYEIWRGPEESTSTMSLIATTSSTTFNDENLYIAKNYYYSIKPIDDNASSTNNFSEIVAYQRCQTSGEMCLIQKYEQNFDNMATNLELPNEWTVASNSLVRTINNYASSTNAVNYLGGNHYEGFENAARGIYNFGAGDKDSATDRAIGGISSNSGSKSINIYYTLNNTTAERISRLNISYNAEKYRNGSTTIPFAIKLYYSMNGVYWIPIPELTAQFNGPDENNNGFIQAPGETMALSSDINLIQELNVGETLYFAWSYSVTSGTITSNARALGVDDVIIKSYGEIGQTPGYKQNFDSIGASAVATLPSNWSTARDSASVRVINTNGAIDNKTAQVGGNNLTSGSAGGIYNFGAGTSTTAIDRSIGGLSSGSNSKSINFYYTFTNNSTIPISDFEINYDVEKYRNGSNTSGFSIMLFYSHDFINWTDALIGTSTPADADNNGFAQAPDSAINLTGNLALPTPLDINQQLYFAWNYSVTTNTSTSNAQGLGIDNINIGW